MEFSVAFSGQMELHFFPVRKRNRLNRIIWLEVSDASGTELPVVLEILLSDDLENYFFGEEDDSFICLAATDATASTFRLENQQSASTVFSLDVAQNWARWKPESDASKRKTQVTITKN